MKINNSTDYVRQQNLGQFRVPEDGKWPFVRMNDQKVASKDDQKVRSVYVKNEKVVNVEKEMGSIYPNLFDYDTGLKYEIEKKSAAKKEEKIQQQYDKTGKTQILNKGEETLIDKLA